ncbi:40S ribosomal protein S7 [Aphelenchoides besseyi]|nr:40S ribosomal protein S7 [Aphelenchoides besseyi]KAI6231020.1 40S ribosomal protein S7 [Aphelenchoides besseyi]
MVHTYKKLIKAEGQPDALEKQISDHLNDLTTSDELKNQLNDLYFVGAEKLEFGNKNCIVIWVPFPQLRDYQKIHTKLVRELEKKFSGSHVVILGKRRIIPKPLRGKNRLPETQKRPRSRTLTSVHDAYLSDLVFPAEVVGRRIRIKLDGKQIQKIHLDKAQLTNLEHKVDTFSSVYKKLTGKEVVFEFPEPLF